ncbi:MAG: hypothetical protein Q9174_004003 [Haloplaca sp. 1 TL-2023]
MNNDEPEDIEEVEEEQDEFDEYGERIPRSADEDSEVLDEAEPRQKKGTKKPLVLKRPKYKKKPEVNEPFEGTAEEVIAKLREMRGNFTIPPWMGYMKAVKERGLAEDSEDDTPLQRTIRASLRQANKEGKQPKKQARYDDDETSNSDSDEPQSDDDEGSEDPDEGLGKRRFRDYVNYPPKVEDIPFDTEAEVRAWERAEEQARAEGKRTIWVPRRQADPSDDSEDEDPEEEPAPASPATDKTSDDPMDSDE